MIERILCATDGSAASTKAVNFAARLASSLSARMTVLAVTTASTSPSSQRCHSDAAARKPAGRSRAARSG